MKEHWMEKIPLEDLKKHAIKVVKKSNAKGQREQDLLDMINQADNRNPIITMLWNLNLSGKGMKVFEPGRSERYDKNGNRKKKKNKKSGHVKDNQVKGLWNPPDWAK